MNATEWIYHANFRRYTEIVQGVVKFMLQIVWETMNKAAFFSVMAM